MIRAGSRDNSQLGVIRVSRKARSRFVHVLSGIIVFGGLIFGLILTFAPFYWMVLASFKTSGELFSPKAPLWIKDPVVSNYVYLIKNTDFLKWLASSMIVATFSTIIGVMVASFAGFAFAKYRFKGKELLFSLFLGSVAIPNIVTIIPIFAWFNRINLVDSYWALILPGATNVFAMFMMRQYMLSIPDDLLEAGRIDGMSELQLLMRIVLPLSRPSWATAAIFIWLGQWSAYLWPLVMLRSRERFTLPLGLASLYANPWDLNYPVLMAGATLATIPMVVLFLAAQEQFISGLTQGATKG